jgi:hypothetical protein
MKSKQAIILLNLILFLLLEAIIFWPSLFYYFLAAINAVLILLSYRLLKKSDSKWSWLNFLILPFLLVNGVLAYMLLLPFDIGINRVFIQILFVLIIVFTFPYFKYSHDFAFHPEAENKLAGLSNFYGFLIWFFMFSAIYGLQLFLGLPVWILMMAIFVLVALSVYQNLFVNRLFRKETGIFVIVSGFIMTQLAWCTYYLPFDYVALGLSMALLYYCLINLVRLHISGDWHRGIVRRLLVFSGIILLLIILTARWN